MCAVKRAGRRRHDIGRNREEAKVSSRVWVHHEAGGPAWLKDCRPRPGANGKAKSSEGGDLLVHGRYRVTSHQKGELSNLGSAPTAVASAI